MSTATTTMTRKLDATAIDEIREAMTGLRGKAAKATAATLADRYGVVVQTVYAASAAERGERKRRADKGKRKATLDHETLRFIAAQVVKHRSSVDEAVTCAERRKMEIPYSVGAIRRILAENGISRRQSAKARRPHRRFEAENPRDLFQFDITGLKERWLDAKTRKLFKVSPLDVSKNHPNESPRRVKVWAFTMVDDFSRYMFTRFYAVEKPTQTEVIDFILAAFREMGVPKVLYTDNDKIITGGRMQNAAKILDRLFKDSGGFELAQHRPGNPQATGKVENLHKHVEECERSIALLADPTLENLNRYAVVICLRKNNRAHSSTGVAPLIRWHSSTEPVRIPPDKELDDLFQARTDQVVVHSDVTIRYDSAAWQLPRRSPYIEWAESSRKVTLVWPPKADYFWIVEDDDLHRIERSEAKPDPVGSYKPVAKTKTQTLRESLEAVPTSHTIRIEEMEEHARREIAPKPAALPAKTERPSIDDLLIATGIVKPKSDRPADVLGFPAAKPVYEAVPLLNKFQAIRRGQESGRFDNPVSADQKAWVAALFADRALIDQSEFDAALSDWATPKAVSQ